MKHDVLALAQRFGTPLYVYDSTLIRRRYQELLACFDWPTRLFYAMKANFNPAILNILREEGASIDAVSPGDVFLALNCGFTPEQILFTANRTTEAEMELVFDIGVLCNIGSLSQLRKYGARHAGSRVCIRLNPDVVAGEHEYVSTAGENNKFGISIDHMREVADLARKYELRVVGIHEHTGSGIPETVHMKQGARNILEVLNPRDFPHLEFVDFGGGFKVPYRASEERVDYAPFGREMSQLFGAFCDSFGRELQMFFEPGKFLVAEAGQLLVTVTDIVTTTDKCLAGVDSGFPQLIRPMFYGAWHEIRNLSNPDGQPAVYDVVGNICESGDCFATDRAIPKISEGDVLAIQTAGAYCYSMGGFYNMRPMPAEVLLDDSGAKLVKRRQGHEELAQQMLRSNQGASTEPR